MTLGRTLVNSAIDELVTGTFAFRYLGRTTFELIFKFATTASPRHHNIARIARPRVTQNRTTMRALWIALLLATYFTATVRSLAFDVFGVSLFAAKTRVFVRYGVGHVLAVWTTPLLVL
jgi:hypothetical protein